MSPRSSIAHYRISAKLGEGGMGEVWRATDTKLNRDVAIKILPEAFALDPDRMARFTRESQVLASLNHPNIAAIYGVEERALVMELVEGPTLAERISSGPIPMEEALAVAKQIAEGLEYAHERGVIHRDLKPANVKITPAGTVKILDFGLAKAVDPVRSPGDPSISPTLTLGATNLGVIMGTAAYMSPEQAVGKPVDRRADVWSFGVVLFELLTGRRMFGGETVSHVLANVINGAIDLDKLPREVPRHFRSLLARCLDRDPRTRLRDIGEARVMLEAPITIDAYTAAPAEGVRSRGLPMWAAALLGVSALVVGVLLPRGERPADRPMTRFSVDLGPDAVASTSSTAAISPDGRRLVYSVRGAGGGTLLATRLLDQSTATVLKETQNASMPFIRPDGEWIGFFADGKLKKVSVQGGAAVTLCDSAAMRGAWWGEDGSIVANLDLYNLYRVPEAGGQPARIGNPRGNARSWRWPQILPGGENVLITSGAGVGNGAEIADIDVVSLKNGSSLKTLHHGGYFGRYLPTGHLIYVHDGGLFAVPFDAGRLETRGVPVQVLDDIAGSSGSGAGQLDFSRTGTLVYLAGKATRGTGSLAWLDSAGKTQPLFTAAGSVVTPRLSPDGKSLAIALNGDMSVYDPRRDVVTRLTFNPGAGYRYPCWMPDGKHIVFGQSLPTPDFAIWWARADGSGQPEKLFSAPEPLYPSSISPDGRRIAFAREDTVTAFDIWTLPLDPKDPDQPTAGQPEPFLRKPAVQRDAAFSPDGHWMAYSSNETSGINQVFVRRFPGGASAGQWQVSTASGPARFPMWSRNGRELFYLSAGDGRIMVAGYTVRGDSFVAERPREWSSAAVQYNSISMPLDLAPDGKRFVVFPATTATSSDGKSTVHVTVLENFFDELKRKVPVK
jgi:serine/threonine-protein kinase